MSERSKKGTTKAFLIDSVFMLVLLSVMVFAQVPEFINPAQPTVTHDLVEDQLYTFTIEVNDPDGQYPLEFTDTSLDADVNFVCFNSTSVGNNQLLLNFTPDNNCVGLYEVEIIAKDTAGEKTVQTIFFNVSNKNDIPVITYADPLGDPSVREDEFISFEVGVQDDDIVYGDYMTFFWYLDGKLSTITDGKLVNETINATAGNATYTPNMDDFDAGYHNVTVVVADTQGANDTYYWNVTVINVNRLPFMNKTFNDTIRWDEDTNLTNNLTLMDYFADLDTNGTRCEIDTGNCLLFNVTYLIGDSSQVDVSIDNESTNVSFFVAPDFEGQLLINFSVFDQNEDEEYNYSNDIILYVLNVNDRPVLQPIPDMNTWSYTNFRYQVNATDVDKETLNYEIGCPTLNISINGSGYISFTPNSSHAGVHTVRVNVSDGVAPLVWDAFTLTINGNEKPFIIPFNNLTINQYDIKDITINGSDPDGDNITIWFKGGVPLFDNMTASNTTSSTYSLHPVPQSLVGIHVLTVYVNDTYNATDNFTFQVEVVDTPMPPVIGSVSVPNDEIRVGKQLVLDNITAHDEDGDIIAFSDDTSDFQVQLMVPGEDAEARIVYTPALVGGPHIVMVSVNDSLGQSDSTPFVFNVTPNYAPVFVTIENMTCEENRMCSQNVDATDANWQDMVIFSDNVTDFEINLNTGVISFIPLSNQSFNATITITDGDLSVDREISVTITDINDPPYAIPNVTEMPEWRQLFENSTKIINITAFDEENDTIFMTIDYINFTDLNGTTRTTDISYFNFSEVTPINENRSYGIINITPGPEHVGSYWVKVSLADNWTSTDYIFNFNITNVNNVPDLNWTLDYPTGGLLIRGNKSTSIECIENTSLHIDVTTTDLDFHDVTVYWYKEYPNRTQVALGTGDSIDFEIPLDAYPQLDLLAMAVDSVGGNSTTVFELNATNINRNVVFGLKRYQLNVSGEVHTNTISNKTHLSVVKKDLINYHNSAEFETAFIEFEVIASSLESLDLYNIGYNAVSEPEGYSLSLSYANTPEASNASEWLTVGAGNNITKLDVEPFLKIKANIDTATANPESPAIYNDFNVRYGIRDIIVQPQTEYNIWFDLDHYFKDVDYDDTLTYGYVATKGGELLNITFQNGHFVHPQFIEEGEVELYFTADDGEGSNATSNSVYILIDAKPEPVPQPIPSSGGGGSQRVEVIKYKRVTVPVSFNILHPENLTIYQNDTIEVPLKLENTDRFDIMDLKLNVESDREGIQVRMNKDFFDIIPAGTTETATMIVNITEIYGSFGLTVTANASQPDFSDSAKIMLTALKQLQEKNEIEVLKYAFVKDLMAKNPECAELEEYIERAKQAIREGRADTADMLLQHFINDCKVLMSEEEKKPHEDAPGKIMDLINKTGDYQLIAWVIGLLTFLTIGICIIIYVRV